jgi:hypothetical protein
MNPREQACDRHLVVAVRLSASGPPSRASSARRAAQVTAQLLIAGLVAVAHPGCAGEAPDDIIVETDTCTDPLYGNGTCDVQTSCAAPDIDCYRTFSDDSAAQAWFRDFDQILANATGQPLSTLVPTTDPRWLRLRGLLDRAWGAFARERDVAELGDLRPGLVLIENPEINAFATSDLLPDLSRGKAVFSVMMYTGIEAQQSDDELASVFIHELQHLVGLHVLPGVGRKLAKFYVAPEGVEPIGRDQSADDGVRALGMAWIDRAFDGTPINARELGGLPFASGGVYGFFAVVTQAVAAANPAGCGPSLAQYQQLTADVLAAIDPLSGDFTPPAGLSGRVEQVLAALRTGCFANYTKGVLEAFAELNGLTVAQVEALLGRETSALVRGKSFVDGIAAVLLERRASMRFLEETFERETGRPWTALRYFSAEEDADDATVPVLRAGGWPVAASASSFISFLGHNAARCRALLDQGQVPAYGRNLTNDHHAPCWRAHHARQLAALPSKPKLVQAAARPSRPVLGPTPRPTLPMVVPFPSATTLDDIVVY